MKFIRFKTRLLFAFWLVLILAICLPAIHIYNALKGEIIKTSTQEAFIHLDFITWLSRQQAPFESNRALDEWYTTLGNKLGYRISIINPGGAVVADSAVPYDEIRFMENHSDRKEVAEARQNGGISTLRYSDTLQKKLIYVAQQITIEPYDTPMVLRLATPLSEVENQLNTYARQFWWVLALIFGFTAVLSVYLARKLQLPVYRTIERVKAIGAGDFSHRFILDSGHEFYELSGAINEMSDRILNQMQVITEQKQEFAAILENMREGVMLLDRNGRIKAMNPTLENIADYTQSYIGKKPMEVFLSTEVQSACDKVLSGTGEYNFTLTQDTDTIYEVYLIRIPEGGALVVFYNISERRRLEKIRRDFVANVSHELKTPLTSVKGYVETLLSGAFSFPEDARSFLQTIHKNTNQMTHIVNDLLQLTRLQEKPIFRKLSTVNAAKCFKIAWENAFPLAEEKGITLENRLNEVLPVTSDEQDLVRVFGNLLQNAIRYTPAGSTIFVYAEEREKDILFAVRDQGPGIAKRHQDRIFERFYRADAQRSRQSGGTGLGLAICRNAVTGMGGRIWVESPPKDATTGSIFFFTLPKPGNSKTIDEMARI